MGLLLVEEEGNEGWWGSHFAYKKTNKWAQAQLLSQILLKYGLIVYIIFLNIKYHI